MRPDRTADLRALLERRILVLDGAMGTMIQNHKLPEEAYRGERFRDWPTDLRGNNDLLVLTRPQLVGDLHRQYLAAGADVIETNTFNSNAPSMADYGMEGLVYELNVAAAQLARAGLELATRRRAVVDALETEARGLYPTLAGAGAVNLQYCAALGPEAGVAEFLAALEARFAEEVRRGQTLVGPHRDDLLIEVDGRDLRLYGSRGQQRLMALTLRLAEVEPVARAVGSPPVLLLDDALSELDLHVQARVLEHIVMAGQVFLTTADATLPEVRPVTWWDVRDGRVTEPILSAVRGAA